MTVSLFLTFPGPPADAMSLEAAFTGGPLQALTSAPDLRFIETYRPAAGDVPQFDDGPPPPLLVELNLREPDTVPDLLRSAAFRDALTVGEQASSNPGLAAVDVFHAVHFPLPGHVAPPARTAPLSFVVRYHRPAPNEHAFVAFYTAHHPLLLARFPGIRNVLCYLPTGLELPGGMQSSGAFFGNEVVFDDLAALNRALSSDVLPQLRAEGKQFPPFGHSTHYAMERRSVHAKTE